MKRQGLWLLAGVVIALVAGAYLLKSRHLATPPPAPIPDHLPTADMSTADATVEPASMRAVGEVDERYQAYSVEMAAVTGGRATKPDPRDDAQDAGPGADATERMPAGTDPSRHADHPPMDLAHPRLRALAQALAPSYMRVSGAWANTTYFADTDTPPMEPPAGYGAILTRTQWLGAIAFSNAVDAPIVTSMPIGAGTRGPDAVWKPDQARAWLAFTAANGGKVAAAEYMNAPTLAALGGAPPGYDAAAYGRDHQLFTAFLRAEHPDIRILAPGSVGEADAAWAAAGGEDGDPPRLEASALAAFTPGADAFSFHHARGPRERCDPDTPRAGQEDALAEGWLARIDATTAFYRGVRDTHLEGKPLWITGTAQSACGDAPGAKTFADTFGYLDQLGRAAKQEVRVVVHSTLAASDDALLDARTFAPRPSYWGALLWRRLMGTTVLESGVERREGLHVYAHCLRGVVGGVALLVINNARESTSSLELPTSSERYTLTADSLEAASVKLNGAVLELGADDVLPEMMGATSGAGTVRFSPESITFLSIPDAKNDACR